MLMVLRQAVDLAGCLVALLKVVGLLVVVVVAAVGVGVPCVRKLLPSFSVTST